MKTEYNTLKIDEIIYGLDLKQQMKKKGKKELLRILNETFSDDEVRREYCERHKEVFGVEPWQVDKVLGITKAERNWLVEAGYLKVVGHGSFKYGDFNYFDRNQIEDLTKEEVDKWLEERAQEIRKNRQDGAEKAIKTRKANAEIRKETAGRARLEEIARQQEEIRLNTVKEEIRHKLPEKIVDFYPLARKVKRHFIIHVGPTNSGKTYSSIQALKEAKTGIYLAPLRLLAYEMYENLTKEGLRCSLITGEEQIVNAQSNIQCSTIEMMDQMKKYDVAVVDEAQMLSDPDRGYAWTEAIMGLYCEEIHICCAEYALRIIEEMIIACDDTYEVIKHERMTELIYTNNGKSFRFPNDVRKGDALIVFSRQDVHSISYELNKKGISNSIIYGALPYDVRQRQADDFASGKTDVLVSTDAIGMGLNLPIERVIFMEIEKYDGVKKRLLQPSEIQQIAGRAGRKGKYDIGYYMTCKDYFRDIKEMYESNVKDLECIYVGVPESLLAVDGKLSENLTLWAEVELPGDYLHTNIEQMIQDVETLESISDDKYLIYSFAKMHYEEYDFSTWYEMFKCEIAGKRYDYNALLKVSPAYVLSELERLAKTCDLIYRYAVKFLDASDVATVLKFKNKVSKIILEKLKKKTVDPRICKRCGRIILWGSTGCDCYYDDYYENDYNDYYYNRR